MTVLWFGGNAVDIGDTCVCPTLSVSNVIIAVEMGTLLLGVLGAAV
jgi:hypothetical protein